MERHRWRAFGLDQTPLAVSCRLLGQPARDQYEVRHGATIAAEAILVFASDGIAPPVMPGQIGDQDCPGRIGHVVNYLLIDKFGELPS